MIIPRRPTEHWIRLIAVDSDDRVLLVREEGPESTPTWTLPGAPRDPRETAERTADALRRRLALSAVGSRKLRERTVCDVVAGEVARREETLFLVTSDRPDPSGEDTRWCTLPELSALPGPPLPQDVADVLAGILDGSRARGPVTDGS